MMSYDEMFSWLLFYMILFDMKKLFMVDVIDFDGFVWLQVIEFFDGGFCVMFNGVEMYCIMVGKFFVESFYVLL